MEGEEERERPPPMGTQHLSQERAPWKCGEQRDGWRGERRGEREGGGEGEERRGDFIHM